MLDCIIKIIDLNLEISFTVRSKIQTIKHALRLHFEAIYCEISSQKMYVGLIIHTFLQLNYFKNFENIYINQELTHNISHLLLGCLNTSLSLLDL